MNNLVKGPEYLQIPRTRTKTRILSTKAFVTNNKKVLNQTKSVITQLKLDRDASANSHYINKPIVVKMKTSTLQTISIPNLRYSSNESTNLNTKIPKNDTNVKDTTTTINNRVEKFLYTNLCQILILVVVCIIF